MTTRSATPHTPSARPDSRGLRAVGRSIAPRAVCGRHRGALLGGMVLCGVMLGGLLAACGSKAGTDGGAEALPNRGIVPWNRITEGSGEEVTAVFVFPDPEDGTYHEPSALVTTDGVELWFEHRGRDSAQILHARSEDGGLTFAAPTVAVTPALAGATFVGAPAVTEHNGRRWMAATVDEGAAIVLLAANPGGDFAVLDAPAPAPADTRWLAPSLAAFDGQLWLYLEVCAGEAPCSLARAAVNDDGTIGALDATLSWTACEASGSGQAAPERCPLELHSPEVRAAITGAGRPFLRMFWDSGDNKRDVSFAASWDGVTWSPYAFNPVLGDSTPSEAEPSSVRVDDTYLLYFREESSRTGDGLRVAVNTPENATDRY